MKSYVVPENYTAEDKNLCLGLRSKKSKAGKIILKKAGLASAGVLLTYLCAVDLKHAPSDYAHLVAAQEYFDGLESRLSAESEFFQLTACVPEAQEYKSKFKTQDLAAQRAFAKDAHYSIQRKIDELGFDKKAHDQSNGSNILFGIIGGLLAYSSIKKGSKAFDEFLDSRRQIKSLEEKYEKIEAEEKERRRQSALVEEAQQLKGGH